ncbi:lipid-A-disaccharide synthase [Chelatococcus asaccharovorans]|uniref:Lipid-A-disaccharide synthase n=1 Tax=Chelatococcus asaccharovorans TaxID=28210 RepID=A0A2V3UNS7_9HYPH|nr:lipid-A-disaccharide synthase [Chelatococcus asaccharovorans]MBS7703439.1 lipid-A-disaccharide synthase [Chelatococcus asaccharovorans]PXW61780.1 lipid-A-disaccharide synthase [Chelatococcus asaccharovorans]
MPARIVVVAGEESGDQLGAKLMQALKRRLSPGGVVFTGVGGRAMQAEGLDSLFPMADIAVMGFAAVIARLPTLINRINMTAAAVIAERPDMLVIIDSPDFTHRVAKRVRAAKPDLPIVDYVSPTVWAWRPGRARKMRAYVDHVLALLPFEPAAHERLGGPPCTYVGHPLVERLEDLRPGPGERLEPPYEVESPTVLVLPGSRRSEVTRLMPVLGETVAAVSATLDGPVNWVLPAVPHVAPLIAQGLASWPVKPRIVMGEEAKYAAFRSATAALAASGTVTLELALARVPMVVGYKVSRLEEEVRHFIIAKHASLPNIILDARVVPEFLQRDCTASNLAGSLLPLIAATPARAAQLAAFDRVAAAMSIGADKPSDRAAAVVADLLHARKPIG